MSGKYVALGTATAAYTACFAAWTLMGSLAPLFREELGLSATQASLLITVPVLAGSLARVPAGLLADHYGGRTVYVALLLFLVVPTALAGFATSYAWLLFWSFWIGIAGASFSVGIPFVAGWFPPRRQGLALGIYGAGNAGASISALLVPILVAGLGLSGTFWAFSLALLATAALFWVAGHDAPNWTSQESTPAEMLSLFRDSPLVWVLSLFSLVTFGGFLALSVHLPTLLAELYGLDLATAGIHVATFAAVATAARPLGGYLSDELGGSRVLTPVFLVAAGLALALATNPAHVLVVPVIVGMGLVLGLGNGAVFKLVAERFPRESGTVAGLVGAVGALGGLLLPLGQALVQDLTGVYAFGFLLLAALALASLLLNLLVVARARPGDGEGCRDR